MTTDSKQIERAAAAWLARRDSGSASPQEHAAFEAWLSENVAHRIAFMRLRATWDEAGRLAAFGAGQGQDTIPARGDWAQSLFFATPINEPAGGDANRRRVPGSYRRARRSRRWPLAAGVAALLVAVVAGGLFWRQAHHIERGAWQTSIGAQQVVRLADGSTATLGSNTVLQAALSRDERDLTLLRGEAFFDVAKDHTRPFVVHVNGHRVIAVGTRFSVRRNGQRKLRVVVTRGLVRLQSDRDRAQVDEELPAGSVALVDGSDVTVQHVALAQARAYLSWRSGYVVFHDTPLVDAVAEFNRYNQHKIVIADPSLDSLSIGGHFRLDNSAAFVRLVQKVLPVRASKQGGQLALVRRDGSTKAD